MYIHECLNIDALIIYIYVYLYIDALIRGKLYSNFSFGEVYRWIYGRKFVLRRRVSGAVKHDFRPYIRRYTSPNETFEYGYPNSNVLFNFYTSKTLYFVQNVSFVSDVNQYVDQSLATLLLTSGFRRYIAGYTVANS